MSKKTEYNRTLFLLKNMANYGKLNIDIKNLICNNINNVKEGGVDICKLQTLEWKK